jgi:hypothetical protein
MASSKKGLPRFEKLLHNRSANGDAIQGQLKGLIRVEERHMSMKLSGTVLNVISVSVLLLVFQPLAIAGTEQFFIYGARYGVPVILEIIGGTAAGTAYAWAAQHFAKQDPAPIDACPPPPDGIRKVCHTKYGDFSYEPARPGKQIEPGNLPVFRIGPIQGVPDRLNSATSLPKLQPHDNIDGTLLPRDTVGSTLRLCDKYPGIISCKQ